MTLITGSFRPARAGIGCAEQAVRRHGNRIRRRLAERRDNAVSAFTQRSKSCFGKAVFDANLIRQPLMMQPRRRHRGRDVHLEIDRIEKNLKHRRNDAAAAG